MKRSYFLRHYILPALGFAVATLFVLPASAQTEQILNYHSDIEVRDDGTMVVAETILVESHGNQIRHGIYRDFPTQYSDRLGNHYQVGFDLLSTTRDGAPEESRIEDLSNGKRIYLGSSSFALPPGRHKYTITYTTNRQLGFFPDHDELFWNVTGDGWGFPIDHASARVLLPQTVPANLVRISGFTGPQGSMARDLKSATDPDGSSVFASQHPLGPGEGLTILLMWPKGHFTEPTRGQKIGWFLADNRPAVLAGGGLVVIFLYYLAVWFKVGRDPAPGVILPLYEPPDFSPAAMRYLVRMGYDNKVFTCAVLNMAVKGFLQIKEQAGSYTLYRQKADPKILTTDEQAVANRLFADGRTEIWLHNENHTQIGAAIASLKTWLKTAEQKIYFVTNGRYMIPAILISVGTLAATVYSQGPQRLMIAGFMCVWLSIWSIGVLAMIFGIFGAWRAAFEGGRVQAGHVAQALFLSTFCIPFLAGECVGLFMLAKATSLLVVLILLATVFLQMLFHYLLKARTSAGRLALNKIEGFKMFLSAVEGDRMNRLTPSQQTPVTFEKYLPYALALDVEQAWAQKFAGVIDASTQALGATSSAYSPSWYSGPGWSSLGAAGFASSLGGSFSSAISSSASAPGSGGGGGGGGSGGGGGGGGGGGW
jgi:uncharacterized membrane protein YgcG